MKRLFHFFKVRRRAIRFKKIAESAANTIQPTISVNDLYTDDGDLGYC